MSEQLPANIGLDEEEFVNAAKDNVGFGKDESIIPFTRILQPTSKLLASTPGAQPGMFLNVATGTLVDGNTGMVVVPVMHLWNYTEWTSRNGQFVKDWGEDEAGWQAECDPEQKYAYTPITRSGNIICKARHFFIYQIDEENGSVEGTIFPFAYTALKTARQWSSMMQNAPKINTSKGMMVPAHFYYTYRITLERTQNAEGYWFLPKVTANIRNGKYTSVMDMPNGKQIWEAAIAFRDSLRAGDIVAATQSPGAEGEDTF